MIDNILKKAFTLAEVLMAKGESGKKCLHLISRTSEPKEPTDNTGFKVAFTLAEVLISLAIIGVVAALTISPMVKNHKIRETEVRVKKFYSTLSQALAKSQVKNGDPRGWDWNMRNEDFFEKYVAPNLQIIERCKNVNADTKCLTRFTYKLKDGSSGAGHCEFQNLNRLAYLLKDGSVVFFCNSQGADSSYSEHSLNGASFFAILVDINGKKAPNTIGKDIFSFLIIRPNDRINTVRSKSTETHYYRFEIGDPIKALLYPDGYGLANANLLNGSLGCAKSREGFACSGLLMRNSWKIPSIKEYQQMGGYAERYPW